MLTACLSNCLPTPTFTNTPVPTPTPVPTATFTNTPNLNPTPLTTSQATVGSNGNTVASTGNAKVIVQPGVLPSGSTVTANDDPPFSIPPPIGYYLAGNYLYSFQADEPSGPVSNFGNQTVTLVFPIMSLGGAPFQGESLLVSYFDGSQWDVVPSTLGPDPTDPSINVLIVPTNHLSIWGVFAPLPTPTPTPTPTVVQNACSPFESLSVGDPVGVALDGQGNLYVADDSVGAVDVYNQAGSMTGQVGLGLLAQPTGIALDSANNLFVADWAQGFVYIFNAQGQESGLWQVEFLMPYGVAVDNTNGYVYVTDQGRGTVNVLQENENLVNNWFMTLPGGVAVDGSGNAYVADMGAGVVDTYDSSGNQNNQVYVTQVSPLAGVNYLGFGQDGLLYVSDGVGMVGVFDPTHGNLWGAIQGTQDLYFNKTQGIALGPVSADQPHPALYVADQGNGRVVAFSQCPPTPTPTYYEYAGWVETTGQASFTPRQGHTSVVYKDQMWVIGGQDAGGNYLDDVWSSQDGQNWNRVTAKVAFGGRAFHTSMVYGDKMWVIGGSNANNAFLNDAWWSNNGVVWNQATASAAFPSRNRHSSVVFNNQMWVLAGQTANGNLNDVWSSSDGVSWTAATFSAAFNPTSGQGSVSLNGQMWVMEAQDYDCYYDGESCGSVWSSPDGVNWNAQAQWIGYPDQVGQGALAYNCGIWLVGGSSGGYAQADIWSSPAGNNWQQDTPWLDMGPRMNHGCVVFNGFMWLIGGSDGTDLYNDVWHSSVQLAHDTSQACLLTLTPSATPTVTPKDTNTYTPSPTSTNNISLSCPYLTSLPVSNPEGVVVGPNGYLYALENHNSQVDVFDPTGAPVTQFGLSGLLYGIAVDAQSNLYITNSDTVFVCNSNYQETGSWQLAGSPYILGIAVNNAGTSLYVSEANNDRVVVTDTSGNNPSYLTGNGMRFPDGIAVDGSGNIYVACYQSQNVCLFDSQGNPQGNWSVTADDSHLGTANFITVDRSGWVYVSDSYGTMAIFDSGGNLLTYIQQAGSRGFGNTAGIAIGPNQWYLGDYNNSQVYQFGLCMPGTVTPTYTPTITLTPTPTMTPSNVTFACQYLTNLPVPNPEGVAVGPNGYLYALENHNSQVDVFDPTGAPVTQFGLSGLLYGIAVDSHSNLYITNSDTVFACNSSYQMTGSWQLAGDPYITGIVVNNAGTSLYVGDVSDNRVVVTDTSGNNPSYLTGNGMGFPDGIAMDGSGNIYVACYQSQNVCLFDSQGNPQGNWSVTADDSHLGTANFITVDGSGKIYVSDSYGTMAIFDSGGNLLTYMQQAGGQGFGNTAGIAIGPNQWYLGDYNNSQVYQFALCVPGTFTPTCTMTPSVTSTPSPTWTTSPTPTPTSIPYACSDSFAWPANAMGIALGPGGNIYCADFTYGQVDVFTPFGQSVTHFGGALLVTPFGIAVDGNNFSYVTDISNDTVDVFDANGNAVTQWGIFGAGPGQFNGRRVSRSIPPWAEFTWRTRGIKGCRSSPLRECP